MALIDRLIRKACKLAYEVLEVMYSSNDDGFIEALGLNPKDYEIVSNGVVVGYDDMAALNTIVPNLWDE